MIRVVIADDHHLVRQGIRALLEQSDDIEVVGEAHDGQQAVEIAQQVTPDVVVLDIGMPRLNGIQAIEKIKMLGLNTACVILSMYSDETLIRQALEKGAKGYLLKRSVAEELLLAVRSAYDGEIYLSPPVSKMVLQQFHQHQQGAQSRFGMLTAREREVLKLIAEGHSNSEIAGLLVISIKTVEKHRASVMSKLEVHDLAGLIRIALKHRLIFLDE